MLRIPPNASERYLHGTMKERDPGTPDPESPEAAADLVKRLARYRRRVEAEGRQKSARLVEQAIKNLGKKKAAPASEELRDHPDIDDPD